MRHSCRAANLWAILDDDSIRPQVQELLEAYNNLRYEDRRGTRLRESTSLGQMFTPEKKGTPIILDDTCFRALIRHLNSRAGQDIYVDLRALHRDPGLRQLLNDAIRLPSAHTHGVSFRASTHSPKDSNVMYWTDHSQQDIGPGHITDIFSYAYRGDGGRSVVMTFLYLQPLKPLSPEDSVHDLYRTFRYVGGWLYYN